MGILRFNKACDCLVLKLQCIKCALHIYTGLIRSAALFIPYTTFLVRLII